MAALPENDRIAGPFIAVAGQTDFPADFPLLRAEGLRFRRIRAGVAVDLEGPALVVADQTDAGFTCQLVTPALAGDRCWVYSRLPRARPRQHTPNGAVRTPTLEADATELQAQLQETDTVLDRALVVPLGERGVELPSATDARRVLVRDPDGAVKQLDPGALPVDVLMADPWRDALGEPIQNLPIEPDGRPVSRPLAEVLGNGYDKTPILNWANRVVLWNGTSIPHQGAGVDSYPELIARQLKCRVVNMAWSSSHTTYDGAAAYAGLTTPLARMVHILSLSMTEADRLAGRALYGPTSAYDDSFDPISLASQQTCDYRIDAAFRDNDISVAVLDHVHNDRDAPVGTLTPPSMTVTGVLKGATTVVQTTGLAAGLAVGDGVAVRIAGVPKLAYGAARVTAVDTGAQTFTLALDTTGFAGAVTGGVAERLDRSTLYGSNEFLIHLYHGAALRYGRTLDAIILATPPSEFTGGAFDAEIYPAGRHLQALAEKWSQSLFDMTAALAITARANNTFLQDTIHPTTREARLALANHWVAWMLGGAADRVTPLDYVARGAGDYVEGLPLVHSKWLGGVGSLTFTETGKTSVIAEDFVSIADWGPVGAPTTGNAPWNPAIKALTCVSAAGAQSFLFRTFTAMDAVAYQFDLYLPVTAGLAPAGLVQLATLVRLETPGGVWNALNLVATHDGCFLQVGMFGAPGNAQYQTRSAENVPLRAATATRVRVEAVKSTATRRGSLLFYIDGVLAFGAPLPLADVTVAAATTFVLGVIFSNLAALTVQIANLTVERIDVFDNAAGFTGTIALPGSLNAKVVGGRIMSVVPA